MEGQKDLTRRLLDKTGAIDNAVDVDDNHHHDTNINEDFNDWKSRRFLYWSDE